MGRVGSESKLLKFKNIVGGATGKLLPAGDRTTIIKGIEVTCLDVSMPIVMANANDFDIEGNETAPALNANKNLFFTSARSPTPCWRTCSRTRTGCRGAPAESSMN